MGVYTKGKLKWERNDNRCTLYMNGAWIGELYVGYGMKSLEEMEANAAELVKRWNCHEDLVEACEALVRDYEAEDSEMVIDPASCVHTPSHTELCPYWLAKVALAAAKGVRKNEL